MGLARPSIQGATAVQQQHSAAVQAEGRAVQTVMELLGVTVRTVPLSKQAAALALTEAAALALMVLQIPAVTAETIRRVLAMV